MFYIDYFKVKKMIEEFKTFTKQNPEWKKELHVFQADSKIYQRLPIATCADKKGEALHQMALTINVKTGEIFRDCTPKLILLKHSLLCFATPIYVLAKTLWHLTIIGPIVESCLAVKKKEITKKEAAIHIVHSFVDIVRTPLYGVAMMVVHLFAVVATPFAPKVSYYTRDAIGKMVRSLNWRKRGECLTHGEDLSPYMRLRSVWSFHFPSCFHPYWNLSEFAKQDEEGENRSPIENIQNSLTRKFATHRDVLIASFCTQKLPSSPYQTAIQWPENIPETVNMTEYLYNDSEESLYLV